MPLYDPHHGLLWWGSLEVIYLFVPLSLSLSLSFSLYLSLYLYLSLSLFLSLSLSIFRQATAKDHHVAHLACDRKTYSCRKGNCIRITFLLIANGKQTKRIRNVPTTRFFAA